MYLLLSSEMNFLIPIILVSIPSSFGDVFLSESRRFETCKKLAGGESPSDVFLAVMSDRDVAHPDKRAICETLDRTNPALVVVKCEKPNEDEEDLRNEIDRVRSLTHLPWAVHLIDEFTRTRGTRTERCYAMQTLGQNLREIREKSKTPYNLQILASMGLQMINILEELHNRYELYHTDVHAANWLVRVDDPGQLSLIDYGYMKRIESVSEVIKELQEMIISLRWYTDLKEAWYVPKKIIRKFGRIDLDTICAEIPSELKMIIEHIFRLTPATFNPATEYETIRAMFISIGAEETIPWREPRHLERVVSRRPVAERSAVRAVVTSTTAAPTVTEVPEVAMSDAEVPEVAIDDGAVLGALVAAFDSLSLLGLYR